MDVATLKDVLDRIHNNSAFALNHAKAIEAMLRKHPDLWKEYQEALAHVESQAVHQDFGSLLGRIG